MKNRILDMVAGLARGLSRAVGVGGGAPPPYQLLANIAAGTHAHGNLTKLTDGALGKNLLVKPGSDSDHVIVATAADLRVTYGVTTDEGAAAEAPVNVRLLVCGKGTVIVQNDGTGALAVNDLLVPAAGGQVKKLAAGAGNYFIVGRCLQASGATAGDEFEMEPMGCFLTQ